MNSLNMDQLREALQAEKGRWKELAASSGVPYDTLTKIAQGRTRNPGVATASKLARALIKAPLPAG